MMVKNRHSIYDSEEHVKYIRWGRICTVYMIVKKMYSLHNMKIIYSKHDGEEHVQYT